jgi:DNA polymerase-1
VNLISFDTETTCVTPIIAPYLVCASISDGTTTQLLNRNDTIEAFREHIRADHITNTNTVFDLGVMAVAEPRLLPDIFRALGDNRIDSIDVSEYLHDIGRVRRWRTKEGKQMIDCWLYVDPESGKDIGRYSQVFLEKRYLNVDRSSEKKNGWRYRYGELIGLPVEEYPEEAREYPKRDALNAWRIHQAQEQHNNREARGRWLRKNWSYYLQRAWGIRTDRARVDELSVVVKKMHDETVARFTACGFYRGPGQINPKTKTPRPYPKSQWGTVNTDVLKARVTKAYRGSPPLTDTGKVSTDRDTLSESGDELLEQFAETGENEKLNNQYLDVLQLGVSQPIHFEYRFIKTGRPAASKPNLFNLPRDARIRKCVIPRQGYVYIDGDYSAIEFATLAQETYELFGRSELRDALIANQDPHVLFASQLLGKAYGDTYARYKASEKLIGDIRQLGKAFNYGKGGGMGVATMVQNGRKQGLIFCVLSGEQTRCDGERVTEWKGRPCKPTCVNCLRVGDRLDDTYFSLWGVMRDYFDLVTRETRQAAASVKGYAFTRAGCNFMNGANFRFQHRAACGQADALWRLSRECYVERDSPLFGCRPVITPYDQTLAEAPEDRAPEAADRLAQVMREEMQKVCPDVPIKVEPVITRRWLKDAKPTRVNGQLEVTEDEA